MTGSEGESDRSFFCSKPWTGFEIEHDGTVQPCCMAKNPCGNIRHQSIEEIWNGEGYQNFRRKMASGNWKETCRPECPRLHGTVEDKPPIPLTREFKDNYQTSLSEIEERTITLKSRPRTWKLTHSTLCNLDCIMCYQDRDDLRSIPERFYPEFAEFYGYIQEIQIIGGEPFAIRRSRDLLRNFPGKTFPDAKFSFVTNGTVHDDKTISLLKALNVSWMSISLDAATAPTYEKIRRGGTFTHTLEGVRKWIALGKEMNFPVLLSFTIMKENMTEVHLFVELAHKLGVDCLFGKVAGYRAADHMIDDEICRSYVELAKAFLDSSETDMPLARITLSSIS